MMLTKETRRKLEEAVCMYVMNSRALKFCKRLWIHILAYVSLCKTLKFWQSNESWRNILPTKRRVLTFGFYQCRNEREAFDLSLLVTVTCTCITALYLYLLYFSPNMYIAVLHILGDSDIMKRSWHQFTLFIPCNMLKSVTHVTTVKTSNVRIT